MTQHFEKSLKFATDEKRQRMLQLIESLAQKAEGALTPISSNPPRVSSFKDFLTAKFSKELNDPKIDNRVTYLTLKGMVLR